jgi:hypothetical protein
MSRFYGLLDRELDEVIEFYPSLEDAEREFAEVLGDEAGWAEIRGRAGRPPRAGACGHAQRVAGPLGSGLLHNAQGRSRPDPGVTLIRT